MDPQIHAAIVGGLIGGATIAGGVILDLRARSRQERRRELEEVVDDLSRTNERFQYVATVGHFDPDGFSDANLRIIELTGRVWRLAPALGYPQRIDIRDDAADLRDMWSAMLMRATKQVRDNKPMAEVGEDPLVGFTLAMPIRRMKVALYGDLTPRPGPQGPFGRMLKYVDEGLSATELTYPETVEARRTWKQRLLRPRPIHPDGMRSRLPKDRR